VVFRKAHLVFHAVGERDRSADRNLSRRGRKVGIS
jgi:hypothetical protein